MIAGVTEIVKIINNKIRDTFSQNENFAMMKLHDIAVLIERFVVIDEDKGMVVSSPAVYSDQYDDASLISPNDVDAIVGYHRITSIASTKTTASEGYGRNDQGGTTNTYSASLILMCNTRKLKKSVDELFLYFQNAIEMRVKFDNYSSVEVRSVGASFSNDEIFKSEFKNVEYKFPSTNNFLRINYTITTQHLAKCVAVCV